MAKLNFIQTMRRIGQISGWSKAFRSQDIQHRLMQKLYEKNGLELKMTCGACPEQYDVFKDGQQIAYYRLRHGEFTVDCPDVNGELIYSAEPNGDGIFDDNERFVYMTKALRIVLKKMDSDAQSSSAG